VTTNLALITNMTRRDLEAAGRWANSARSDNSNVELGKFDRLGNH
jgi:hypothetical protein